MESSNLNLLVGVRGLNGFFVKMCQIFSEIFYQTLENVDKSSGGYLSMVDCREYVFNLFHDFLITSYREMRQAYIPP